MILVIVINLFFLRDFWGFGVIWEDWQFLLNFKIENYSKNLIIKILKFWLLNTNHWGLQTIYLGIFDQFFPSNYFIIQVFNVIGKITATILLYPLVVSLTKNKLLAIFSTLIYAVHYSSYGSLQQYMTGVEYWAIVFVILFVLIYRKIILDDLYTPIRLFGSLVLLYLSLAFGLYRLNAFIILLFIAELIMFFRKNSTLKKTLFRIAFFIIVPIILVFLIHRPDAAKESLIYNFLSHILKGNLFIFISPLAGLALTFVPRPFISTFEIELLQSSSKYFSYIINYFALPFTIVVLALGTLLPVKSTRFWISSLILSSSFIFLLFSVASRYTGIPRFDIVPMAIIGSFILAVSFSFGIEWFMHSKRKSNLLFLLFIAPLISIVFLAATWVLKIDGSGSIVYQDGMHRYLTVPAIASSIVFSIILLYAVNIIINDQSRLKKLFSFTLATILVSFLIFSSLKELRIYKTEVDTGRDLSAQKTTQENFYNNNVKSKGDIVFYYLSPVDQKAEDLKIERALYPQIIGWWSFLKHYYKSGYDTKGLGCIMVLAYPWHQKEATIREEGGRISFQYPALCPITLQKNSGKIFAESRMVTLSLDNLFAFTIKGGVVTDITAETKKRLIEDPGLSTPEETGISKSDASYSAD